MNVDFWIGFMTGAVTLGLVGFMLELLHEYASKKRRKIKDEWK